jgi:hypothetical protein
VVCSSLAAWIQVAKADESTGQVEQPSEQIGSPLVGHTEATTAEQPGERALDHPAVPTQPLAGVNPPSGNPRSDTPSAESAAEVRRIVGLIRVQLGRPFAGPPWLSPRADNRRDGVDQRKELSRVVGIGCREPHGQGDAIAIDDEVVFRSRFTAVDWVAASLLTPLLARTLSESTLARFQSMPAWSPSQLSSVSCKRFQTPTCCQSRNRRQQVVPLPQPNSFGSKRHGQPVRRTKTIPPSVARFGTGGRPPLGFGGSFGSRGSIASQRSSETRGEAFMACHQATSPRF